MEVSLPRSFYSFACFRTCSFSSFLLDYISAHPAAPQYSPALRIRSNGRSESDCLRLELVSPACSPTSDVLHLTSYIFCKHLSVDWVAFPGLSKALRVASS